MPELPHIHRGRRFSIMESDAVDWLITQPEIRQLVWNMCKAALVLDIKTGNWSGLMKQRATVNSALRGD
jgi:hypothetical protein